MEGGSWILFPSARSTQPYGGLLGYDVLVALSILGVGV